ncbi:GNAT family N-acetyltransferase [Phenylobacterium sp.]|uniref:GNAT family N-acetyltransferase n=1 Tax=Phenylobacterium sp. TaxID=1871053 RepID=UPI00273078B2|nr:GNAT family protein [Phenylobacterium sp.]MDP2214127.1 GNAT family protein [Phenylobacterium sp.]
MQLEARNSHNRHVRLEPLAEHHRAELQAACAADLSVWRDLYPHSMAPEHFDAGWDRMMAQAVDGSWIPHAVLVEGRCIGMTSYIAPDGANATVEIGGTYYHPDQRGGPVNPAAKRLMLEHAFESGARRVQLNVDAINLRSRAAVLKLGAVQEGILRHHRVVWTGRIRDTVVFSILAEEWPAVRARLDARLEGY